VPYRIPVLSCSKCNEKKHLTTVRYFALSGAFEVARIRDISVISAGSLDFILIQLMCVDD
jgi:hypothetical protein